MPCNYDDGDPAPSAADQPSEQCAGSFARRHQAGAVRALTDSVRHFVRPAVWGSIRAGCRSTRRNLQLAKRKAPENDLNLASRSPENWQPLSGDRSGERWCSEANPEPTQGLRQLGAPLVDASAADAAHERSSAKPPAFAGFCATRGAARARDASLKPFSGRRSESV